ncbi:hypothetical protein NHN17_25715, partial [Photobacterium sp. ZSDE20]
MGRIPLQPLTNQHVATFLNFNSNFNFWVVSLSTVECWYQLQSEVRANPLVTVLTRLRQDQQCLFESEAIEFTFWGSGT